MSCRRSSRFWGLGCPKIFHEIEDSLVTVTIQNDWTQAQAVAAYEAVDALREAIWSRYELQLIEQMREEQVTTFAVDDDVTF